MRFYLAVSAPILFACFLSVTFPLPAQLKAVQPDSLAIAQRYDLRRRINGKYSGLFYGNANSYWRFGAASEDGRVSVSAMTYLMEESIRNLEKSEKTLSSEMKSSFLLDSAWAVSEHSGDPAPLSRGFPSLPAASAVPGDAWEAPGLLVVDPKATGSWTKIKTMVGYELKGKTRYDGKEALDLRARFAIRYKPGQDPDGDPGIQSAEGTREAWIYLDAESLQPLFIREKVSGELFRYSDGTSVQNDGFILSFFSGGSGRAAARESNKEKLERRLEGEDKVALREDERGLSLTIQDLRFVADSPELLPGEEERLIGIANALKALPLAQTFLVVGHTADVGTAESQLLLSLERARRVSAALAARGIDPSRFIVDGKGGTQAIADNSTEEGRALNRRVEIVLLD
jgi:OOP family OmpA-OmpF porin